MKNAQYRQKLKNCDNRQTFLSLRKIWWALKENSLSILPKYDINKPVGIAPKEKTLIMIIWIVPIIGTNGKRG